MRLLDNLHCYIWMGRGNNCNTYVFADVLRGDRPHVLIDPGQTVDELNEPCLERLLAEMARDSLAPEDIGLIINTHAHYDHFGATQALLERARERPGKPAQPLVTLYEGEAEYLKAAVEYMGRMGGQRITLEPNFYLKEGELILGKEGKLTLQVLHTPGHTPGSISLYWPDGKVLITGDLLFYGGVGRTDFGGDGKQLKHSIERLEGLDIEYLLPGHSTTMGSIIKGGENVRSNFASVRLNYFPML